MLIITEKPSVAKDFAAALGCTKKEGFFENPNKNIIITHCYGHLYQLAEPALYDQKYKAWNNLPVIPETFHYTYSSSDIKLKAQAELIKILLVKHKNDDILIATDADREGEIIARECFIKANIKDFTKIKRFWVSQALTKEVILDGIKNAKPLSEYNKLANQGFARQHADWLVGINFTRYISVQYGKTLPVGRVQTAILSAINQRCNAINNFTPQKYYMYYGNFKSSLSNNQGITGLYINENGTTKFPNTAKITKLLSLKNKPAVLIDKKEELKKTYAPTLYNLNDLQKDAYKFFEYSADKTLEIIQSLYEDLKCVSYPRTPSRVMGSSNVVLCQNIYSDLSSLYKEFSLFSQLAKISLENKRCFNDSKLEAHHAIIPLKELPASASEIQKNIYRLILDRFFLAFLPEENYKKLTFILDVTGEKFICTGKQTIDSGWKKNEILDATQFYKPKMSQRCDKFPEELEEENDESEIQEFGNIDWNSLKLVNIEQKEKCTKPPKYFNEASILSFMENPKNIQLNIDEANEMVQKLESLGTPATRHTYLPKLKFYGYIDIKDKKLLVTEAGKKLLQAVEKSSISSLADISQTTDWETKLSDNPKNFILELLGYISNAVTQEMDTENIVFEDIMKCPKCSRPIRKSSKSYFCTGYNQGCDFPSIWIECFGTKLTQHDVELLLQGKKTSLKHCKNKDGKIYECKLYLEKNKVTPYFDKKTEIKRTFNHSKEIRMTR